MAQNEAQPEEQAVPKPCPTVKCETCGRRPSERIGLGEESQGPRGSLVYEATKPCPDPIHDRADALAGAPQTALVACARAVLAAADKDVGVARLSDGGTQWVCPKCGRVTCAPSCTRNALLGALDALSEALAGAAPQYGEGFACPSAAAAGLGFPEPPPEAPGAVETPNLDWALDKLPPCNPTDNARRELEALKARCVPVEGAVETPLSADDVRKAVETHFSWVCDRMVEASDPKAEPFEDYVTRSERFAWEHVATAINARLSVLKASARNAPVDTTRVVDAAESWCRADDYRHEAATKELYAAVDAWRAAGGKRSRPLYDDEAPAPPSAERILTQVRDETRLQKAATRLLAAWVFVRPSDTANDMHGFCTLMDELRDAAFGFPAVPSSGGAAVVPSEIGFEKVLVDSAVARADAEDEAAELRAALVTLRPKVEKFCPSGLPLIDKVLGLNPAPSTASEAKP